MLGTMTSSSSTFTPSNSGSQPPAENHAVTTAVALPIFLVHPSAVERRRLSAILETTRSPLREYSSAGELINTFEGGSVACLVCDADLGGSSGLHLIAQLHAMGVVMPTVMLVSPGDVYGAVAALKAGVGEVVVKPVEPGELLHAVRSSMDSARGTVSSRETSADLLRRQAKLSNREIAVFRLITRGLSNKEAAQEVGVACKTIEIHRANVMKKMGAHSLADLVRQAVMLEGIPSPLTDRAAAFRAR